MWGRLFDRWKKDELYGERSLRHVFHLDLVKSPGSSDVVDVLELKDQDADGQEQEEAGKEDAEKDEEVQVQLVLSERHLSERRHRIATGR